MTFRQLAGSEIIGTMPPSVQFFVGEAPIITDSAPALVAIEKWQLLCLTETGVRPFVWTAKGDAGNDDPSTMVISAYEIEAGKQCPYYEAGRFNFEVIKLPDALTDAANPMSKLPMIKAELRGSMIKWGHLVN